MRSLLTATILGFVLCLPSIASEPIEQPHLSVPPAACVRVHVKDKGGEGARSAGSGAYLGQQLIVTAAHVVKDRQSRTVEILFPSWEVIKGDVVHTDKEHDLAFIKLENDPRTTKPLVFSRMGFERESKAELSVNGYGYGIFKQSWGTLSPKRWGSGGYKWNSVDGAQARSGDSGGPILDASGWYAGTLWGSVEGSTYFTPVTIVLKIAVDKGLLRPEPADVIVPTPYDLSGRYHLRTRTRRFFNDRHFEISLLGGVRLAM